MGPSLHVKPSFFSNDGYHSFLDIDGHVTADDDNSDLYLNKPMHIHAMFNPYSCQH